MQLEARGHPLHTRALTVELRRRADAKLDVLASIVDVRKRGFVPVAGDLQSGGIVHLMTLNAVVDAETRKLTDLRTTQPHVAFEPSALTRGESCRDPVARIAALEGIRAGSGYARRLNAEIGGPRGCSHILTLAQLLGSTVAWVLGKDPHPEHRPGERVFRRDVSIDGFEVEGDGLEMIAQLIDLHLAPAPEIAPPMQRFASQLEINAVATVAMKDVALTALRVEQRERDAETLETAVWRDRSDLVQPVLGAQILKGIGGRLVALLGENANDRPLLDTLLMLAPAFVQCSAGLSEPWARIFKDSRSLVAMGGFPDSCYMWRRDGALALARKDDEPPPRLW